MWPTPDGSLIHLQELPNYEPTCLIWFRANCVLEADKSAHRPPAKKEKGTTLFDANVEEVPGRKLSWSSDPHILLLRIFAQLSL